MKNYKSVMFIIFLMVFLILSFLSKSVFAASSSAVDEQNIYQNPNLHSTPHTSAGSLQDMMKDAEDFMQMQEGEETVIETTALQKFSNVFYGIFLNIGIVVAVIVGLFLGIKFMISSAGEKADVKKLLVPYLVGCVVIFGGFGLWKIVVTVLQGI